MSRSRVLVIVFTFTAFLIFTIHLRTSSAQMYHRWRKAQVQQTDLKQQLWNEQLRFECLINPAGLPQSEEAEESQ